MHLKAPCQGIDFTTRDIFGDDFQLSNFMGRRIVLSFFRDAACPFCNYRVYELTHKYKAWKEAGLEVVIVFSDTAEKVRKHVARHPRPFHMISDPDLALYNQYGVEQSAAALFKAMMFRLPTILKGILKGGRPSNNPHIKLVPADFLIETDGRIVDLWYGRNTADHIPLERLDTFAREMKNRSKEQMQAELETLRAENQQLKSETGES